MCVMCVGLMVLYLIHFFPLFCFLAITSPLSTFPTIPSTTCSCRPSSSPLFPFKNSDQNKEKKMKTTTISTSVLGLFLTLSLFSARHCDAGYDADIKTCFKTSADLHALQTCSSNAAAKREAGIKECLDKKCLVSEKDKLYKKCRAQCEDSVQ